MTAPALSPPAGRVRRVAGPVVAATGLPAARLFDVVRVGAARLPGEVIRIDGETCTIQVFEDTTGLRAGEPVEWTGSPLVAELGPGLLGSIVDGTGRPLLALSGGTAEAPVEPYVPRGADPARLDRERRWDFEPAVSTGNRVGPGDLLGTVAEGAIRHRVLVPHGLGGVVTAIHSGPATVEQPVAEVDGTPVTMLRRWPVRQARPHAGRLPLNRPLVTGQRVLDTLFPVALGGSAIIPGGFGTGKTVLETALAKHAHVDVVVYVGCGERGNELTEVLEEFPRLTDPATRRPLMERTVLVANTSNMPVAAREASVYLGVTIAEYYRDQGYAVALMADSTSRWGEAMREVSSRLEEVPAEDGYPAYLAARLAGFYERAGAVECLGADRRRGSVTLVGAVSPAGGDFSEPITQNSLRLAGCFWALDTSLARRRHFPAVNWTRSYTQYGLDGWYAAEVDPGWPELRRWTLALLQQETALADVVQLLGLEALAPEQRVVLRTGRLLREDFLQQSSFDPVDAYCPLPKQAAMLRVVCAAHEAMTAALAAGAEPDTVTAAPVLAGIGRMRDWSADEAEDRAAALTARIRTEVAPS